MRDDAITLLPAAEILDDDAASPGVEAAFDEWRDDLRTAQSEGTVRAYRLPVSDDGTPNQTAKNQVQLGQWPVDQCTLDELCEILKKKYMLPHERFFAVRFIGTQSGKKGVRFSQVVTMQRANDDNNSNNMPARPENAADMMRVLGEMQRQNAEFLARLSERSAPPVQSDPLDAMAKMVGIMAPLMSAVSGRGSGVGDLKQLVETMALLDDMRGDRAAPSGDGGNNLAGILQAVSPMVAPLLQMAAANKAAQPAPVAVVSRRIPVDRSAQPTPNPQARPTPQTAPPAQPQLSPEQQAMFAELKPVVDALVGTADNGAPAVDVANMFFEQSMMPLDDDGYTRLVNFLENPNSLKQLAFFSPGVNKHQQWFTDLRAQLLARISAESAAADTEADPAP
jgi:hypothetical protein